MRKRMCDWETHLPPAKKMEALSSVKMTVENCLGTIYCACFGFPWPWWHCLLVAYSGHFFAKVLSYFAKVLFFCMTMPGVILPTGQLFMAVKLIGYGSVPILQSLFYLSLNPWEAPGWQVIGIDADVKQVVTSWLQKLDNSVFALEYKPWYHCGANVEMVVVTTLRSDVYHLLHMCHVLIKVTTFWHEGVCYLIFWKFFLCTLLCEQVIS